MSHSRLYHIRFMLRQAYDYWQDQPGICCIDSRRRTCEQWWSPQTEVHHLTMNRLATFSLQSKILKRKLQRSNASVQRPRRRLNSLVCSHYMLENQQPWFLTWESHEKCNYRRFHYKSLGFRRFLLKSQKSLFYTHSSIWVREPSRSMFFSPKNNFWP